ncbi:hypothetical protein HDV63DRAFT_338860 [Trichoderma sp. SZMC 28014]
MKMKTNFTHQTRASCDYCAPAISLLLLRMVGSIVTLCSCSAGYIHAQSRDYSWCFARHGKVKAPFPFPISMGWGFALCDTAVLPTTAQLPRIKLLPGSALVQARNCPLCGRIGPGDGFRHGETTRERKGSNA